MARRTNAISKNEMFQFIFHKTKLRLEEACVHFLPLKNKSIANSQSCFVTVPSEEHVHLITSSCNGLGFDKLPHSTRTSYHSHGDVPTRWKRANAKKPEFGDGLSVCSAEDAESMAAVLMEDDEPNTRYVESSNGVAEPPAALVAKHELF